MGSLRDNLEGMQAAAAHHAAHHRDSDGEELDDSIMILGTTPQARSRAVLPLCCRGCLGFQCQLHRCDSHDEELHECIAILTVPVGGARACQLARVLKGFHFP